MTESIIGGRRTTITKEGADIKIVFHPLAKGAKHPNANVFTVKISKEDLNTLKKLF